MGLERAITETMLPRPPPIRVGPVGSPIRTIQLRAVGVPATPQDRDLSPHRTHTTITLMASMELLPLLRLTRVSPITTMGPGQVQAMLSIDLTLLQRQEAMVTTVLLTMVVHRFHSQARMGRVATIMPMLWVTTFWGKPWEREPLVKSNWVHMSSLEKR